MNSPGSSVSSHSSGEATSSYTQHLKDLLKLNGSDILSPQSQKADVTGASETSTASLTSAAEEILRNTHDRRELQLPGDEMEQLEERVQPTDSEILNSLNQQIITKQQILLQGDDQHNSFSVYGQNVTVIASEASACSNITAGSNKVKINPVVNFDWEHKYYVGNLVAVHRNGLHVAYVLRGKSGGVVRVINRRTAERALLKGFTGKVVDISFAHLTTVLLGAVDELGCMFIYDVVETPDNKIEATLLLHVQRPEETIPSDYHRLIWCPYIPEDDDSTSTMNTTESLVEDVARLLLLTHGELAEMWNVDMVTKEYGCGPIQLSEVEVGYLTISSHSQPILDASFSPDGTAVATASQDGDVKFFQVYLQDKSPPRCLHQWQPHDGKPVHSLFFLDDHKHPNPEVQYWKFAVTGADNNREIRVWSCESWTCLQTLTFLAQPDLPSNFQTDPCLKVSLDLSANYLLLSDIKRKVLYVLQLFQDCEASRAHVSSVSEFLLAQPCLSLAVLDAARRKFHRSLDHDTNHVGDLTTGEVAQQEEEEVTTGTEGPDIGVLIRLYTVHTKAMQEMQIRFHPQSSVAEPAPASLSSISQDEMTMRDRLSDMSMDTVSSEAGELSGDILLPGPAAVAVAGTVQPDLAPQQRPLLMTPESFVAHSSSPRKSESLLQSSSSSTFTHVTAMDDVLQTPRGFMSQSQPSPGSSLTITPTSSRDMSATSNQVTPTSVPLPPSTPGEEKALLDLETPRSPPPSAKSQSSVSQDFMTSSPASSHKVSDFEPPTSTVEAMFHTEAKRRTMLQSTGSSSSTSLEVSEILEGARRPGQDGSYEQNTEEEIEEVVKDVEIEEEGETDIQEQVQEGSEILPTQQQEMPANAASGLSETTTTTAAAGLTETWPKPPQVDEDAMQAKRLAWEAIDRAQRAEALRLQSHSEEEEEEEEAAAAAADFQDEEDVKIEGEPQEGDEEPPGDLQSVGAPSVEQPSHEAMAAALAAASGEPGMHSAAAVDITAITELQKSVQQLVLLVQSQQQQIQQLSGAVQQCSQGSQVDSSLQTLQTTLTSQISASLSQHSQAESQKLHKVYSEKDKRDQQRQADQLVTRVSQSVERSVSNRLDAIVRDEMNKSVMPGITRQLEPLKEQLHTEMAQKLTATDSLMRDNIAKLIRSRQTVETIGQAAGSAMQGSIQGACRDLLIPSFDRACQGLFQQLNQAFHRGTHEYVQQLESHLEQVRRSQEEARDPILRQLQAIFDRESSRQQTVIPQLQTMADSLQSSVQRIEAGNRDLQEHLHSSIDRIQEQVMSQVRQVVQEELAVAMKDTQSNISDQLLSAMRSGAVTPVALGPDPQQQQAHIMQLLRQGQVNLAFQQALSASDLSLVLFVCESVSASEIFSQTPCPLQQPVLLSLIQQLSADLSGNVELKHRYLEESVMNLDQKNAVTKEHMPAVLGPLCQKLMTFCQNNPHHKITKNMRMLLMVSQSLLK